MKITDYIPTGKRNAITITELKKITGRTARGIAKLIRDERISGTVILTSSNGGYWLPDYSDSDISEQLTGFIRYMDSKNTYSAVKSAKTALKKIENSGQMQIGSV